MKLELGRPIEVLRGMMPPMVDGRPMVLGDMLLQLIQGAFVSHSRGVRLWRIAIEIDKLGSGTLELSDEDAALVKEAVTQGERPAWVQANVEAAFG